MKFCLKCLQSQSKGLMMVCLISFVSFVHADNGFSLEEINTMARQGVKVAFSGERDPHVVTMDMTPEKLAQAEMLDLNNLSLHTLPAWLAQFTKLRDLNLAHNALPLEELEEVKAMRVLEVLDLSYNQLFSRDHKPLTELFSFLPNLRVLSLAGTLGDECDVWQQYWGNNYPNKESYFSPNYNDFNQKFGDFKKLGALEKLNISHNCIAQIDLATFSSTLQELDLSYNYLQDLPFVDMPSLQKLSLNENNAKLVISDKFADAFVMQQLRLIEPGTNGNVIVPEGLIRKLASWKPKKTE